MIDQDRIAELNQPLLADHDPDLADPATRQTAVEHNLYVRPARSAVSAS